MSKRTLRADSLAVGLSVVLIVTILQRAIGFVRGIWFCRLLDDASLGQWAMGFGFISLVTPMLLFGLPGSLPRFIETYRQRGRLGSFLVRILAATAIVTVLGICSMVCFPTFFATGVFGEGSANELVFALAFAVFSVIVFNVTNEITAGLRLVRIGSLAQFLQSVSFTVIGILWLYNTGSQSTVGVIAGVMIAFGISSLLGTLPGCWALVRGWEADQSETERLDTRAMWRRILPYAAAIWAMNLLSNSFELADRYMLLHFSQGDAVTGQRYLGQYHSSLIIPYLFISLANMASGVLTPYLAADWERGEKAAVVDRVRRSLMATSLAFTAGAAVALWIVPFIFHQFLNGRYDGGLGVMPICFVFCVWFAIATLAQTYLWVAERGKLVALVMAIGLAANIGLNAILVPRIGLDGAVWGTCLSHLIVLSGIWWAMNRCGYRLDATVVWITLQPALLLAGSTPALISVALAVALNPEMRQYFASVVSAAGCQFRAFAR